MRPPKDIIYTAEGIIEALADEVKHLSSTLQGCRHKALGDHGTAVAGSTVLGAICARIDCHRGKLEPVLIELIGQVNSTKGNEDG